MVQILQIKCPKCGKVLQVKQQEGLEKAYVTCPVCKTKSPFTSFLSATTQKSEDTELPGGLKYKKSNEDLTDIAGVGHSAIGCLTERSGKRWNLHHGVNTIGRKLQSDPQQVDIAIYDYTGERKMSRNHAKIEVISQPDGSCKHVFFNWQNKNNTYIDGELIETGDRIVLHNGMTLRFANVDVRFVIEDTENTEFTN